MKEEILKEAGWAIYYNANYWVHPKTVEDPKIQDYTNYGMSLDDAYDFELNNKHPFPPQPDVIKILKNKAAKEAQINKMEKKQEMIDWHHIKELANSLTNEQLKQKVKWWSDEDGGSIMDANILDEDYVSDGGPYVPRSEMPEREIDLDKPIVTKGTVMLWVL